MSDDKLLQQLGEIARERQAATDARWEALVRGELSDEERAALLAEHGMPDQEITPLGADFTAKMTDRMMAEQRRNRAPSRWWMGAVPVVALAAAALLWVQLPGTPEAVCCYGDPVVEGFRKEARSVSEGPAAGPYVFVPDGVVRVSVPFEGEPGGPVAASAWLVDGDALTPWAGTLQVADSGAVRLKGAVRDTLGLAIGDSRQLLVIAHPADAEGIEAVARAHLQGEESPWSIQTVDLRVEAP